MNHLVFNFLTKSSKGWDYFHLCEVTPQNFTKMIQQTYMDIVGQMFRPSRTRKILFFEFGKNEDHVFLVVYMCIGLGCTLECSVHN